MERFQKTYPWLKKQFEDSHHAARCSGRLWVWLWSNLVIEQTLIQTVKCSEGLTRRHGFGEIVCNLWTMSIGHCVALCKSMVDLFSVNEGLTGQIIEMRSRILRIVKKSATCLKSENSLI